MKVNAALYLFLAFVLSIPAALQALTNVLQMTQIRSSAEYTQQPHPKGYVCYRAAIPPPLDGKVEGGAWDHATWTDTFIDIEGPDHPLPYLNTSVKMLWDDQALYIGAWMDEPQPWATYTLHDSIIYQENDFEVFIDPDGDNHQYYEFEVNALGTLWDLFLVKPYRDGGPALVSWESVAPSELTQQTGPTGWQPVQRAVHIDGAINNPAVKSRGWGVTMAFPWSLLQQAAHRDCPPKSGDQWRVNFSRVQWITSWDSDKQQYVKDPPDQKEYNWVWAPQYAIAMHQPETWGYVQFSNHTADGGQTLDSFKPDITWPVRSFLMEVYKRQKAHLEEHASYAVNLDDLGLTLPQDLHSSQFKLETTEISFIARAQVISENDVEVVRMYVNEEGRLTKRILPVPATGI